MEYIDITNSLQALARQEKGITLIRSRHEEDFISYRSLWNNSVRLGQRLLDQGVKQGDEVVILCRDTKHLMHALWACMIEGFIATPMSVSGNAYSAASNAGVYDLLSSPFLLYDEEKTIQGDQSVFGNWGLDMSEFSYHENEKIILQAKKQISRQDDIAYIQFSSGSTGDQKGAIITKKNLFANISDIIRRLEMTQQDISLSWQPLTHCYGLIVFHLLPIMLGIDQYLIETAAFMKDPLIWLDKIHAYRATRLGTIPFALKQISNLAVMADNRDWNLSCVKSITIGGEQVTSALCNEFTDNMQPYHLQINRVIPIYGLAESTTCLSMGRVGSSPSDQLFARGEIEVGVTVGVDMKEPYGNVRFMQQGPPLDTVSIRITDENGESLPEGTIGYIHAKGNNIVSGYYKNKCATQTAFMGEWLDTGDIGALVDGNIVVMGRKKELIIVNGKKYNCIDLENLIENEVEKSEFGQVVVCNGMDIIKGAEQAIIFVQCDNISSKAEFIGKMRALTRAIKETVYQNAGIVVESVVPIGEIPRTYSGKLRRTAMANMYNRGDFKDTLDMLDQPEKQELSQEEKTWNLEKICEVLVDTIDEMLGIRISDYNLPFQSYGIVSANIPPYIQEVNRKMHSDISVSDFFSNPNINRLAAHIIGRLDKKMNTSKKTVENPNKQSLPQDEQIAIIGMSCRFPGGANSIEEFWEVLMLGKDAIVEVPENRWEKESYFDADDSVPGKMYCKKGGFLDMPIDSFDAQFFNISPKEAAALDPQQRMLLELTWEAFENGNLDITKFSGSKTGVYLGMSTTEYMLAHLYSGDLSKIDAYSLTGTCMSTACGRISYTFGFEGPCMTIDTACSSSLTALHTACNAIAHGEISAAVVAGINYMASPATNIGFSKLRATSPGGQSKAFDASADGYGRSEGGGAILIKRLSDAVRDQDNILGVIRGTGINQDGQSNGLTAPSGKAQADLIRQTLDNCGLQGTDIDYVEMHGTGTKLGDPIEVKAVAETYAFGRSADEPLKIGSVKSNIGHLEAGAGMASIIKVLMCMQHNQIPGNLHFHTPNPFINWKESNIEVLAQHTPWDARQTPRRAAINGFGFGGSNAHVVLEEYRKPAHKTLQASIENGMPYLMKVSAKSESALEEYMQNYINFLETCEEDRFADLVYTANRGRADFEHRLVVTAKSKEELVSRLKAQLAGEDASGVYFNSANERSYRKNRPVVFMFTGQGSQYINMGKMLYDSNPVFQEAMDLCDTLFRPYTLCSLTNMLYGETAEESTIQKTIYAQPLIFSIEYALYKLWEHYGIEPEMVMGHSIGEYAAAVAADIMELKDAVKLVSIRGRLMDVAPGKGAMGTVFATRKVVEKLLAPYEHRVSLAAYNARESCVISGQEQEVKTILADAQQQGIRVQELKVSHAFHSPMMEPILNEFREIAGQVSYRKANKKFISALYAREIGEEELLGADYWTSHIRDEVNFYDSLTSIEKPEQCVFLEVGASRVLSALCKLTFDDCDIVESLNRKKSDDVQLAESIAALYTAGIDVNWDQIVCRAKTDWEKILAPTYPFQRECYFTELNYDRKQAGMRQMLLSNDRLLGQRIETPSMPNTVIFQNKYSALVPYFMHEHIIFDTAIAPAAGYVSLLISAVKELKQSESCAIRSMELRAPLAIAGDNERLVQVCISDMDKQEKQFSIVSRDFNDIFAQWVTHTVGTLEMNQKLVKPDQIIDFDTIKSAEVKPDAEQGIYASMKNAGFSLGDGFRRITKTYQNNGKGVCFIEPLESVPDKDMYIIYPGIIDSVFQTMLSIIYEEFNQSAKMQKETRAIIPYCFGQITYNYVPSDKLWCDVTAKLDNDMVIGDIHVFDESGESVMEIKDFMAKLTSRNELLSGLKNANDHLYYREDWINQTAPVVQELDPLDTQYILLANHEEFGKQLLGQMEMQKPALILCGAQRTVEEKGIFKIDRENFADWDYVLAQIQSKAPKGKLKFIYAVGEQKDVSEAGQVQEEALKDLLYLVQAIVRSGFADQCKLKILTENVQSVENETQKNLSGALVWGFAKTLGAEYPALYQGIVDVDTDSLVQNSVGVVQELLAENFEEVCLRGTQNRYVSRLVSQKEYQKSHAEKLEEIVINEDATYLITGAAGNLGMTYAQFLAESGARNLAFLCRSEPKAQAQKQIAALREEGVRVEVMITDVSQRDSVECAVAEVRNNMPAVRGVVHAAGTLKDAVLTEQNWESFKTVLAPKVDGTVNLYHSLSEEILDFFITLSSITSLVGNVGQSNYGAANYFMNKYAEYLSIRQVPAFSVCWGPWEGSGMASQNELIQQSLAQMGINMIQEADAMHLLKDFFEKPANVILVADVKWGNFLDSTENKVNHNMLSKLMSDKTTVTLKRSAKDEEFLDTLTGLTYEEKTQKLLEKLQKISGKIMGFSDGQLPSVQISFREQGVDSLMLFSIRSEINKLLSTKLEVSAFFNYPTLQAMTEFLSEELWSKEEKIDTDSTEDLLQELVELAQ